MDLNEFNCECSLCLGKHKLTQTTIKTTKLCKIILLSIMSIKPNIEFYSLKQDIHPFITKHLMKLKHLKQFQQKNWKKSILDAFNHSTGIESGKTYLHKNGFYRLNKNYFEKQNHQNDSQDLCFILPSSPSNSQEMNVEFELNLTLEKELSIQFSVLKNQLRELKQILERTPKQTFVNDTNDQISTDGMIDWLNMKCNSLL